MKRAKKVLFGLVVLVLLFMPVSSGMRNVQAASAKTYQKRARKVKKNLPKKVKKLVKKAGYWKPTCRLVKSKRSGATLKCWLQGAIGEGAYMLTVRVNLKNGKAKVVGDNMVDIASSFKVSMK